MEHSLVVMTYPRMSMYVGLSSLFRPPETMHICGGVQNSLLTLIQTSAQILQVEPVIQACAELSGYLTTMQDRPTESVLEEVSLEYTRLFVGPGPPLAYPYESVYRTPGGRVMGDCTLEILQMYQEEGLYPEVSYKDLPDHIAMEMEYMAYLCQKEEEAKQEGNDDAVRAYGEKERRFLDVHLASWVPQFCARIIKVTSLPFYRYWAIVTGEFISWDTQYIRSNHPEGRKHEQ